MMQSTDTAVSRSHPDPAVSLADVPALPTEHGDPAATTTPRPSQIALDLPHRSEQQSLASTPEDWVDPLASVEELEPTASPAWSDPWQHVKSASPSPPEVWIDPLPSNQSLPPSPTAAWADPLEDTEIVPWSSQPAIWTDPLLRTSDCGPSYPFAK